MASDPTLSDELMARHLQAQFETEALERETQIKHREEIDAILAASLASGDSDLNPSSKYIANSRVIVIDDDEDDSDVVYSTFDSDSNKTPITHRVQSFQRPFHRRELPFQHMNPYAFVNVSSSIGAGSGNIFTSYQNGASSVPSELSPKRRKRKRELSPPPQKPMEAGKNAVISFRQLTERPLRPLLANERNELIHKVLGVTRNAAAHWRRDHDQKSSVADSTIEPVWNWISAAAISIPSAVVIAESSVVEVARSLNEIMHEGLLRILVVRLHAFVGHQQYLRKLEAVAPAESENENAIDCIVCAESWAVENIVPCGGETVHFLCRPCFRRYITETVTSGGTSGIPCCDPGCNFPYPVSLVRKHLSAWDVLCMDEREEERNKRVGLATKASLHCQCGTIGVVTEEDIGNGCLTCPGCDTEYCVECGNEWHEGDMCPAPAETMVWIDKKTKACPNCHMPIEKTVGCDHMYCAPPGGCGHHFNYSQAKSGAQYV